MQRCQRPRPHHRHDWTDTTGEHTCPGRRRPVTAAALQVAVLRTLVVRH